MGLPHAVRWYTEHALGHYTTENAALGRTIPKFIPATPENVFNFPWISNHNLGKEWADMDCGDWATTERELCEPATETEATLDMMVDGKDIAD